MMYCMYAIMGLTIVSLAYNRHVLKYLGQSKNQVRLPDCLLQLGRTPQTNPKDFWDVSFRVPSLGACVCLSPLTSEFEFSHSMRRSTISRSSCSSNAVYLERGKGDLAAGFLGEDNLTRNEFPKQHHFLMRTIERNWIIPRKGKK